MASFEFRDKRYELREKTTLRETKDAEMHTGLPMSEWTESDGIAIKVWLTVRGDHPELTVDDCLDIDYVELVTQSAEDRKPKAGKKAPSS